MYLYIELWNARSEWLALSQEERIEYMNQVGEGIQVLSENGIELVGLTAANEDGPHRANFQYIAAWKMPTRKEVSLLENMVEEAGWHTYFHQVNACGELKAPEETIGMMVAQTEAAVS